MPAQRAAFGKDAGIRVRMYRVGFGDFFLLSLKAPDGTPRHILIDCGVHAANINAIGAAIDQLATDTGKQLSLVIMTHRHADHISGFSSGKAAFATFNVERVWMPWYDDPKNQAAVSLQSTLTALAANLQIRLAARNDPATAEAEQMANNITGTMSAVGGQTSNTDALDTLQHGFKAPVDYYQAGDTPTLPASLVQAGLTAQILGPPIDQALVQQMDGKGHQYLAANADDGAPPKRFDPVFGFDGAKYPDAAFELYTREEVEQAVADAQPDLELAKAAQSDQFLNNQSLVVLFGFGGKTMLFAGDAQWGNWQNFLFGGTLGTPGTHGPHVRCEGDPRQHRLLQSRSPRQHERDADRRVERDARRHRRDVLDQRERLRQGREQQRGAAYPAAGRAREEDRQPAGAQRHGGGGHCRGRQARRRRADPAAPGAVHRGAERYALRRLRDVR